MNIFILDNNHSDNVAALCDSHVVKMTLETAQILSSAATLMSLPAFPKQYKATHSSHPCVLWAASSIANLKWLTDYGLSIAQEYSYRYSRTHASEATIASLHNMLQQNSEAPTNYAIAIKEHLRNPATYAKFLPLDKAIVAYREYYIADKLSFAKYCNGRLEPLWLQSLKDTQTS